MPITIQELAIPAMISSAIYAIKLILHIVMNVQMVLSMWMDCVTIAQGTAMTVTSRTQLQPATNAMKGMF